VNSLKELYILGAGGFGREVAWLVSRINDVQPTWDLKGFIDNNSNFYGKLLDGYYVIGDDEYLLSIKREIWIVCTVASAKVRKKIIEHFIGHPNIKFATLIDPSVIHSNLISVGEGSIICAGTIISVDISIGKHVIINLDCTIGHDGVIKDFVTINPSVNVSGNTVIEKCVELGTGTQIIQGIHIGEESIIGAGSVVIRNIPDKCTAVGSPAKPIKYF
jgi:sugar O-acyltransferase (sialic acid O-acetyltransferase NeuD family)